MIGCISESSGCLAASLSLEDDIREDNYQTSSGDMFRVLLPCTLVLCNHLDLVTMQIKNQ